MDIDPSYIEKYGILGTILVFIGYAVWRSAKYLGLRLLDEDKGIFTRVGNKYVEQMEVQGQALVELKDANARLAATAEKAHNGLADRDRTLKSICNEQTEHEGRATNQKIHRAWAKACDMLEVVGKKYHCWEEIEPSVTDIRREMQEHER